VNRYTGKAFIGGGLPTILLVFVVVWLGKVLSLGPVALQLLGAGSIMVPIAVAVIASSVVCYRA
jgi:hypothetical protein